MNLNTKTGEIRFAEKLLIAPQISFSQMKKQYPDARISDMKTGYFWINFDEIRLGERIWSVSACYCSEQLHSVHLDFRHWQEKPFSWDDWTEESQLALKKRFEKWISETIGAQTQFPWGKIGAYYNPKDSLAIMIISYHKF